MAEADGVGEIVVLDVAATDVEDSGESWLVWGIVVDKSEVGILDEDLILLSVDPGVFVWGLELVFDSVVRPAVVEESGKVELVFFDVAKLDTSILDNNDGEDVTVFVVVDAAKIDVNLRMLIPHEPPQIFDLSPAQGMLHRPSVAITAEGDIEFPHCTDMISILHLTQ
jgi:hypothetical protein